MYTTAFNFQPVLREIAGHMRAHAGEQTDEPKQISGFINNNVNSLPVAISLCFARFDKERGSQGRDWQPHRRQVRSSGAGTRRARDAG